VILLAPEHDGRCRKDKAKAFDEDKKHNVVRMQ
jgi:hypothetical protein